PAAVVKADAYGLGMAEIAPALAAAGCPRFFVATVEEGLQFRAMLPHALCHVLHGPMTAEEAGALREARLRPVLNAPYQLDLWERHGGGLPATLQVDTGMTRLGLTLGEAEALAASGRPLLDQLD